MDTTLCDLLKVNELFKMQMINYSNINYEQVMRLTDEFFFAFYFCSILIIRKHLHYKVKQCREENILPCFPAFAYLCDPALLSITFM